MKNFLITFFCLFLFSVSQEQADVLKVVNVSRVKCDNILNNQNFILTLTSEKPINSSLNFELLLTRKYYSRTTNITSNCTYDYKSDQAESSVINAVCFIDHPKEEGRYELISKNPKIEIDDSKRLSIYTKRCFKSLDTYLSFRQVNSFQFKDDLVKFEIDTLTSITLESDFIIELMARLIIDGKKEKEAKEISCQIKEAVPELFEDLGLAPASFECSYDTSSIKGNITSLEIESSNYITSFPLDYNSTLLNPKLTDDLIYSLPD